jgi:DNA replicative helicase MCM subunit Mcm2 (Cdc46/Mcm family)
MTMELSIREERVLGIIRDIEKTKGSAPKNDILNECGRKGIMPAETQQIVESLVASGHLYVPEVSYRVREQKIKI